MTWEVTGYRRALDGFEDVLSKVAGSGGDGGWEASSPCEGWSAWDVAGHVVGGQYLIKSMADGSPKPEIFHSPGRFCTPDPVSAWLEARAACTQALTPAALQRHIPFGAFGEPPLQDLLGGSILEVLVHTWDLAQATHQAVRLPPDLVHHAFATAQLLAPIFRKAGHYGPALKPPPRADELTRLLAFLGRSPLAEGA